nr:GDYXXLXY domain-containing protein [uncultured Fluviicola sp.]
MNNLKRNLIITNLFLVFTVFAWMWYGKEELLQKGDILVLKLQPADPRSFMMGDYMALSYDINDDLPTNRLTLENLESFTMHPFDGPLHQEVVVKMKNGLGVYVRMKNKKPLGKGEFVLPCKRDFFDYHILPDEYLFQEGRSKHFNQAEYAQFRVNKSGDVVIEYLLDINRKPLR